MAIKPPVTLEKAQSLSRILSALPFPQNGKSAPLESFTTAFDRLAFSVAIFLFAAVNVIPGPPGTSIILGIPLVITAIRKALGLSFWLPRWLLNIQVSKERYQNYKNVMLIWLKRIETYIQPRGHWHKRKSVAKALDIVVALLSICVLIPLPFTAILPAASIGIITMGRMEYDGRWITGGLILGSVSAAICGFMTYGSLRLISVIFSG